MKGQGMRFLEEIALYLNERYFTNEFFYTELCDSLRLRLHIRVRL